MKISKEEYENFLKTKKFYEKEEMKTINNKIKFNLNERKNKLKKIKKIIEDIRISSNNILIDVKKKDEEEKNSLKQDTQEKISYIKSFLANLNKKETKETIYSLNKFKDYLSNNLLLEYIEIQEKYFLAKKTNLSLNLKKSIDFLSIYLKKIKTENQQLDLEIKNLEDNLKKRLSLLKETVENPEILIFETYSVISEKNQEKKMSEIKKQDFYKKI